MGVDVENYYKHAPTAAKKQLQELRNIIREALDQPEEVISYQIPHFVYNGKKVVAIAGWKQHVALYPLSSKTLKKFAKELSGYKTSAGTVQFPLDKPLPKTLIVRIIKQRLSELGL